MARLGMYRLFDSGMQTECLHSFYTSFDRRFRVYDISDYGETIQTYKRTEKDEIVDEMVLVGRGAPPPYDGFR